MAESAGCWSRVARTTLLEFVVPRLVAGGHRPALVFDDGVVVTCSELLDRSQRLARYLADYVTAGDRVAIAVGNRAEWLITWFAVLANRAVLVKMNPALGPYDAQHILQDSGAVLAVADSSAAQVLASVQPGCAALRAVPSVDGPEPDGLTRFGSGMSDGSLSHVPAACEDVAMIGYTSGTTGGPKACPADHLSLLHYADVYLRERSFDSNDRFLSCLQFHYGDPLWMFLVSLYAGAPLIVMRTFSVSRFWDVVADHAVTQLFSIGSVPSLLLKGDAGSREREHGVKFAVAVGVPAAEHQALVDRFGFPWLEAYGLTETGPVLAMPAHLAPRYVGSGAVGTPSPEVLLKLLSDDGLEIAGAGTGVLYVKGPFVMSRYLGNAEANAEAFQGGWFCTGDILRRDDEGMYYFIGRRKEIIRRSGENVAPFEVEAVLRLHPDVVDVAVVPVADDLRGEEIKAYVELKEGASFQPDQLVDFCDQRLSSHKVPRYIERRMSPFPRTPSQRVRKPDLMTDGAHAVRTAWDRLDPRHHSAINVTRPEHPKMGTGPAD